MGSSFTIARGAAATLDGLADDGEIGLYVGRIPGRKRESLCVIDGSVWSPVTYFASTDDAERFVGTLDELIRRSGARITEEP